MGWAGLLDEWMDGRLGWTGLLDGWMDGWRSKEKEGKGRKSKDSEGLASRTARWNFRHEFIHVPLPKTCPTQDTSYSKPWMEVTVVVRFLLLSWFPDSSLGFFLCLACSWVPVVASKLENGVIG